MLDKNLIFFCRKSPIIVFTRTSYFWSQYISTKQLFNNTIISYDIDI